ncbi:hypothetical protein DMH01_32345 [Amycolatopsis sp. WAC 04182]|uniref:hypothetical protein n=1 Tax=Amycolatopsis sp. WAC 04182 TaxID=2203198 RepID=UPI000F789457|nr:hypothetical protein [Amycolatopsis sp. WAC 04182]RSN55037.1 hypothetical protein DMH01_32345 [Amycolatopsis sp. WAC 04182]
MERHFCESQICRTYEAIFAQPVTRDLEWTAFVALWNDLADFVVESGEELTVTIQGRCEVFCRPSGGWVSTEDVERAREALVAPQPHEGFETAT